MPPVTGTSSTGSSLYNLSTISLSSFVKENPSASGSREDLLPLNTFWKTLLVVYPRSVGSILLVKGKIWIF